MGKQPRLGMLRATPNGGASPSGRVVGARGGRTWVRHQHCPDYLEKDIEEFWTSRSSLCVSRNSIFAVRWSVFHGREGQDLAELPESPVTRIEQQESPLDEKVSGQRRPADATGSRLPAPVCGERAPMPTHHGGGGDDLDRLPPVWPDVREQHPEQPIDRTEARSFRGGPLQHGKLMPERENFGGELESSPGRCPKRG